MSAFLPNCRVDILDTAFVKDDNGDLKPDDVVAAEGLPAFWAEKNQRTFDPVSGRWSVITAYQVKLRPGTEITEDQRLRRQPDGLVAQVNQVVQQEVLSIRGDVFVRAIAIER